MKKILESNLQKFVVIGVFILLTILLFNLFNTFELKTRMEGKLIEIKELTKPAKLELISIETGCGECFSIDEIVAALKDSDMNITRELTLDSSSQEAKVLMGKYNIEKFPTIILTGEIDKASIQSFRQEDDALIFDDIKPPYVDAKTEEIIGRVSAVMIEDKSCEVCYNFSIMIQGLQQNNVVFSEVRQIDFISSEAGEFITKYEIKKIPSLLLSADIDAYPIAQDLKRAGFQFKQDYHVIESQAPYVEADTGKIRGLATLIMITDDSCQECYDVTIHKQILASLGLTLDGEKSVDISSSEGRELMSSYNITKVPMIILTGDIGVYESLNDVWQQVGTVEDDGAYVFREIDVMGDIVYRDLSVNEIVGEVRN